MIEPNSPEWKAARAGKITASRACDVIAFAKKGGTPLKSRMDYIGDIVAELLTGEPKRGPRAASLEWGHDVEGLALAAYCVETGAIVERAPFLIHPEFDYLGATPDALVGSDGQVQAKCPENPCNHIAALRGGMPEEHMPQVQFELMVTGRQWCDFVSYDPRMRTPRLRLYRQRIARDESYIAMLAAHSHSLWAEVQSAIRYLTQLEAA